MKQKTYLHMNLLRWARRLLVLLLPLIFLNTLYAQEHSITGVINDEDGSTMPGVNVIIKGTTTGAVSDVNGKYTIKVPNNNAVLVFSFVGYTPQEIEAGNQTSINVALKQEVKQLNDVVVVGYGVQKKSDLTGAIASVSGDNLLKNPSSNISEALQGKAAGVTVMAASGMPGASIIVRVRGLSSVNGQDPLYVIDGMPGDKNALNSLNPNDIASIEVLKDASSQAIYGSAGGAGVVLVTTKKGSNNEKTTATVTMYTGIQDNGNLNVKLSDTKDYMTIYNRIYPAKQTIGVDSLPNTNWWDVVSHKALMQEYNVTVSGGTQNSTSLIAIGYFNQDGIVKQTNYKRYSLRVNTDSKITSRIKIGEDIALSYVQNKGQYDNASWGSVVNSALTTSPVTKVGDAVNGWGIPIYGMSGNPAVSQYYGSNKVNGTYRLDGNVHLSLELLKNLTYTTRFGGDINFYEMDNFVPQYYVIATLANPVASVERELDRAYSINWQHVLDYKNTFLEDHNVEAMAGFESKEYLQKTLYAFADSLNTNGATPEFQYLNSTLRPFTSHLPKGDGDHSTGYGYFGRVNYDYKNIFLGQFSIRRDGSSNFAPDHQFGNFPAFSLGVKFTELPFVKENLNVLDFGKIRYGWGKTGFDGGSKAANKIYSLVQQQLINGYAYSGNLTIGSSLLAPGNADLHWEDIVTNDIGIDLAFLKNRLTLTVDYYDKENEGMLVPVVSPAINGRYVAGGGTSTNQTGYANIGGLSNKGLEFSLGYKDKAGDLNYSFDLNITKILSDKLVNMKNDSFATTIFNGSPITMSRNGYAPSMFWGYKTNGIYHESDYGNGTTFSGGKKVIVTQPHYVTAKGDTVWSSTNLAAGDIRYVDINHDGKINPSDMTNIGNPNPDFTYGFSGSLTYKGFDMNFFFQGSYGNKIFNTMKSSYYNNTGNGNWVKDALNAYRAPTYDATGTTVIDPGNTSATQFKLTGKYNNYQNSDWYVEDGSYLRLKSLQFGYSIPSLWCKFLKIEKLRIYVGAKNLLTFTKYSGTDPEIGSTDPLSFGVDYGVYPQARTYLGGLELKF